VRIKILFPILLSIVLTITCAGQTQGTIVTPQGRPAVKIKISAIDLSTDKLIQSTATDINGKFELKCDCDNKYFDLVIHLPQSTNIRIGSGFSMTDKIDFGVIQLPIMNEINGTVIGAGRQALTNAEIKFHFKDPKEIDLRISTDSTGRYQAIIPNDLVRMEVWSQGYMRMVLNQPSQVVALQKGLKLAGRVLKDRKPIGSVQIESEGITTTSKEDGTFILDGLPAKKIFLKLSDSIGYGAIQSIDLTQASFTPIIVTLNPVARLAAKVVSSQSKTPITGAIIKFYKGGAFTPDSEVVVGRSNHEGRFESIVTETGKYTVICENTGFRRAIVYSVDLEPGKTTPAFCSMEKAVLLSGTVVDEKGDPASSAVITIKRSNNYHQFQDALESGETQQIIAIADANGKFVLSTLRQNENYAIEAVAPLKGHALHYINTNVKLKEIRLILQPGILLIGVTQNEKGDAIANASIAIRKEEGGMPFLSPFPDTPKEYGRTDRTGRFLINGLEIGKYSLLASAPNYSSVVTPVEISTKISVEPIIIRLPSLGLISGTVTDVDDKPISGALLSLASSLNAVHTTISDGSGTFQFSSIPISNIAAISARAEGYASASLQVKIPAKNVHFKLLPGITIRGRVIDDSSEKPVQDFYLDRVIRNQRQIAFQFSPAGKAYHTEDGTFELSEIPSGSNTWKVHADGYKNETIGPINIDAGATPEELVFRMKKGKLITGRVIDASTGNPISNVSIHFELTNGGDLGQMRRFMFAMGSGESVMTGEDGTFLFQGLPDDPVSVYAYQSNYVAVLKRVEDGASNVEIEMQHYSTVSGVVVDATGHPPANAQVSINPIDPGNNYDAVTIDTDPTGSFFLGNLNPGNYRLAAARGSDTSNIENVALAAGQNVNGVTLTIGSGNNIQGRIVGLETANLLNSSVMLHGADYYDSAKVDQQGAFSFPHVPSGSYSVTAVSGGTPSRRVAKQIDIQDSTSSINVELVFDATSVLNGTVMQHGSSVPNANIYVFPTTKGIETSASGMTDQTGTFSVDGLTDGDYLVAVNSENVRYQKPVTITGNTTINIDIPSFSLIGTISSLRTKAPLGSVAIQLTNNSNISTNQTSSTMSGSNGQFNCDNLDEGTYTLTASKAGYRQLSKRIVIGSSNSPNDLFLIEESSTILQVDQNSILTSHVDVNIFSETGSFLNSASIDLVDGAGELPTPQPGTYNLYIYATGRAPVIMKNVIFPAQTLYLSFNIGGKIQFVNSSDSLLALQLLNGDGSPYMADSRSLTNTFELASKQEYDILVNAGQYKIIGAQGKQTINIQNFQTITVDISKLQK